MKTYTTHTFILLALACSLTCTARNNANTQQHQKAHPSYKEEAGDCSIPSSQFSLDVNNVRARLLDAGDLWWDLTNGAYEVPKAPLTGTSPQPNAIFAGSIWVSALDQGNNLRIAAEEYRQGTADYFTGPLDNTGNVTMATCNMWDMHFPVWGAQISALISLYAAQGNTGTIPIANIPDSIKYWPATGNPYLSALGYDVSGVLAPFFDANGDGIYNPINGDYPTLKQGGTATPTGCGATANSTTGAYADEMVFWVMNDVGNAHGNSGGAPLGIQVNALAYAFQSSDAVNDMTFYNYNIINKSGAVLNQAYLSQWTDVDLGCANNDRVGCDTSRSLAITYNGYVSGGTALNGVTCDEGSVCPSSEVGYGCDLPMLGIQIIDGPADTAIDPVTQLPKKIKMTSFCYFTNGAIPAQSDPTAAPQYRNYMTGRWADGSPQTYGGDGYNGGITQFPFAFPGDPAVATQWSECNPQTGTAIPAGDRRMVQTAGPFTFLPCASQMLSVAVIFIQPQGGVGSNCPSFNMIDSVADQVSAFARSNFDRALLTTSVTGITAAEWTAYPNPVSSNLFITQQDNTLLNAVSVYDITGKLILNQTGKAASVDLSTLTEGVYFVKINGSDKVVKVIKN